MVRTPAEAAPIATAARSHPKVSGAIRPLEAPSADVPTEPRRRVPTRRTAAPSPRGGPPTRRQPAGDAGLLTLLEVRNELVDGPLPAHTGPVPMDGDLAIVAHVEDLFYGIAGSDKATAVSASALASLLAMYAVPRGCTTAEAADFIKYLHETSPTTGEDPTVLTLPDFFVVAARIAARAMDGLFFATMSDSERLAAIELKRGMGVPLAGYEEGFEREQRALRREHSARPRLSRPSSSFQSIGRSNHWVRPGLPDAPKPPRPSKLERHLPRSEAPATARIAAPKPLALPAPPVSSRPSSRPPSGVSAASQRSKQRASSARRADDPILQRLRAVHGFRGQ